MKLNQVFLIGLALSCVTAASAVAWSGPYVWRGSNCAEVTPFGDLIRWVSRDVCRQAHPTHYGWSGPDCGEFTPHGVWIRRVPRRVCYYGLNSDLNGSPNRNAIAELESAKDVSASETSDNTTGAVAPGPIGTKQAVE